MSKNYRYMWIGLFIVTFHINSVYYQLLPSFLGWFLVAFGVAGLCDKTGLLSWKNGSKLVSVLCILTFIDYIMTISNRQITHAYWFIVITSIIELLFLYNMLQATTEMFQKAGKKQSAIWNERILTRYSILHIIGLLLLCKNWADYSGLENDLVSVYMVGLRVFIIIRIMRIKKLCRLGKIERVRFQHG